MGRTSETLKPELTRRHLTAFCQLHNEPPSRRTVCNATNHLAKPEPYVGTKAAKKTATAPACHHHNNDQQKKK
jgi:hypothetical protein